MEVESCWNWCLKRKRGALKEEADKEILSRMLEQKVKIETGDLSERGRSGD